MAAKTDSNIGTVSLPVVNSLIMGTDLPSLWALQGLFLFVVLIVCGASYQIERFYTVNMAVLTAVERGSFGAAREVIGPFQYTTTGAVNSTFSEAEKAVLDLYRLEPVS